MSKVNSKVKQASNSVGVLGWLFLVLFWLKMNPGGNFTTDVVNWSWWLVTLPLWGPLVLVLAIVLIVWISMVVINAGDK